MVRLQAAVAAVRHPARVHQGVLSCEGCGAAAQRPGARGCRLCVSGVGTCVCVCNGCCGCGSSKPVAWGVVAQRQLGADSCSMQRLVTGARGACQLARGLWEAREGPHPFKPSLPHSYTGGTLHTPNPTGPRARASTGLASTRAPLHLQPHARAPTLQRQLLAAVPAPLPPPPALLAVRPAALLMPRLHRPLHGPGGRGGAAPGGHRAWRC